jgi:hypothetical protein
MINNYIQKRGDSPGLEVIRKTKLTVERTSCPRRLEAYPDIAIILCRCERLARGLPLFRDATETVALKKLQSRLSYSFHQNSRRTKETSLANSNRAAPKSRWLLSNHCLISSSLALSIQHLTVMYGSTSQRTQNINFLLHFLPHHHNHIRCNINPPQGSIRLSRSTVCRLSRLCHNHQ